MSVFDRIDHYIADFRRARELAKTERMIRALPSEVQKDIGWPDASEESRRRIARIVATRP
ncbi:MAG TPA: hypothetical protein VHC00_13350 [Rhizobiaceae bacterium]|nr:hypothetical protein [Rhizobiaceae bacterium]